MAKPVASRGTDQFMVRFPMGLRDHIRDLADANGRSMNSEIIDRLEASVTRGPDRAATALKRLLLAVDLPPDDVERVSAIHDAFAALAQFPIEAAKNIRFWKRTRPDKYVQRVLAPMEVAEIERAIETVVAPEVEAVVLALRREGWTIEPPRADDGSSS